MVQLFLLEPNWNEDGDSDSAKRIIYLLNKLESVIHSLVTCGGQSEARLWLCNTISDITSIAPRQQRGLFVNLLRSKPTKWGNPARILQWFSDFAGGGSEHKRGAKALSHFACTNRDFCWEELEWKGRHGQSPAVVATKPHYFLDLDVQRTVENFLENVPEFWSSNEFAESLKDGQIFFLDTKFFVDLFVDLIYKEDSSDVWEVINEFLMEETFSSLTHRLLITIEERDFCIFLELLRNYVNPSMQPKDFGNSSYWLEIILSKCSDREPTDQILLLNAVINQGRQLLRLVRDEDSHDKQERIKDIMSEICTSSGNANILASVLKECFKIKAMVAIKLLGLLSWVIYYRLSEEGQAPEYWESLFSDNGIRFHKSDKYALLRYDEFSEENEPELDDRTSTKSRHCKKSRSGKKRRTNFNIDFRNNDELLDFDISISSLGLQYKAGSWMLSTDGFSASWTMWIYQNTSQGIVCQHG